MNFKSLKKIMILAVVPLMLTSGSNRVLAGGGVSKAKISSREKKALEISYNQIKYAPVYAEDGGLAYFWLWNCFRCKKDFDVFVKRYASKIDNITSARTLLDSIRDEGWKTLSSFGNCYTLESFEEAKDPDARKYLLRVDEKNNLIYTVRKSGDLYLFTFYLASCIEPTDAKLCISCFAVSSDMRNIKNILLPVDRALFD